MKGSITVNSTLQFLGAADTVTGSRYLVTTPSARVLVDCGLFQGYKVLRERNRAAFPVPPDSIDAVVISHAHLDHTGYLPALVRDGFRGHIYATHGTAELSGIMLPDSAHLLEEEARFAAKAQVVQARASRAPLHRRRCAAGVGAVQHDSLRCTTAHRRRRQCHPFSSGAHPGCQHRPAAYRIGPHIAVHRGSRASDRPAHAASGRPVRTRISSSQSRPMETGNTALTTLKWSSEM